MTFICQKCNKIFKSNYHLSVHNKRKTPCNEQKENLNCESCGVNFNRKLHYDAHLKTKKHIHNISIDSIHNNSINGNNNNILNKSTLLNIAKLTLVVNTFDKTNLNNIKYETIKNLYDMHKVNSKFINKPITYFHENFKQLKELLKDIHFNIRDKHNHNLKILLLLPGSGSNACEYLILEIDPNTQEIHWNRLEYHEFIDKLLEFLERLQLTYNIEGFEEYVEYMNNEFHKEEYKSFIERDLMLLYKNYNKDTERKKDRKIGKTLNENAKLYKKYREEELILPNGYLPKIVNPLI